MATRALLGTIALVAFGCAGVRLEIPGGTVCDGELKADVYRTVCLAECGPNPSCSARVVDTRVVFLGDANWLEEWVVNRADTLVYYAILLLSDPGGTGTTFMVRRGQRKPVELPGPDEYLRN
jgi:hypothetical protein